MAKHLHLAIIFKASNLNYGESIGNILSLKKLASEGKNYSYISRQALRYDIVRLLNENYNFGLTPTDRESGVVQFAENTSIQDYPEIDYFGYMKTGSSKMRKGIVRLTDATSLEPFNNDTDFATNMGLANRNDQKLDNDIFQSEIHKTYYSYTITFNLDAIGEDTLDGISLTNPIKAKRVKALCNILKLLYRDIRGKRENLSPLFIIGGLYDCGNPFFYNRLKLEFKKEGNIINAEMINNTLDITMPPEGSSVMSQTILGCVTGEFININEIKVEAMPIEEFFGKLMTSIDQYYK
ncbi:MAG TPA: type I-B CRISPR-associated protein Cas7/Cst2/DevR [Smithellaceae bacterium]|jgi:CRISPR-associated protein Cst2|nr:type I-B CRISPR-associated protein Cas7/Cst2/DevR [Smithellaceae bacterium]HQP23752.1 type I-B CRISPR-associated protein Cas7/Cst2/DevR [Smithellaceae bacterium]HRY34684.1 type I-B CRISPR-associated protein Cas7/Cst2/DevR [Smithellaceae bacterium]